MYIYILEPPRALRARLGSFAVSRDPDACMSSPAQSVPALWGRFGGQGEYIGVQDGKRNNEYYTPTALRADTQSGARSHADPTSAFPGISQTFWPALCRKKNVRNFPNARLNYTNTPNNYNWVRLLTVKRSNRGPIEGEHSRKATRHIDLH